jgi:hypothetical protein
MSTQQSSAIVPALRLFARKGEALPITTFGRDRETERQPLPGGEDRRAAAPRVRPERHSPLSFLIQRDPGRLPETRREDALAETRHAASGRLNFVRCWPEALPAEDPEMSAHDELAGDRAMRRKMTVRLRGNEFHRCRSIVERLGVTYQSVLEHAIRSYFAASDERSLPREQSLPRQSAEELARR